MTIAAGFTGVACVAIQDAPVRRVHAVWSKLPTPAARAFMDELLQHVAGWQNRYGIVFSVGMRVVFNGIVPAMFCALIPGLRVRRPGADG